MSLGISYLIALSMVVLALVAVRAQDNVPTQCRGGGHAVSKSTEGRHGVEPRIRPLTRTP
jgi:hypothetical protein